MKINIKWTVEPPPTGQWRSFYKRGWPIAYYKNEEETLCAQISCGDKYIPSKVKTGDHKELTLVIYDYSSGTRKIRKAIHKPKTLKEAKELLIIILTKNPQLMGNHNG